MQIFVLRHGQAETQLTTDEMRNLTEKGRRDVADNINQSLPELLGVKEIWSSPLIRAKQTADIARDILCAYKISVPIKTIDIISPESNPADLLDVLQSNTIESILIASHQPFLGEFLDIFCGSPQGAHPMNTASLALLEYEIAAAGFARLRWLRHING